MVYHKCLLVCKSLLWRVTNVWSVDLPQVYFFFKVPVYFETLVPLILLKENCFALPLRAVNYLALPALMMITKFLDDQLGTLVWQVAKTQEKTCWAWKDIFLQNPIAWKRFLGWDSSHLISQRQTRKISKPDLITRQSAQKLGVLVLSSWIESPLKT